jgi:hypothetical protein
MNQNAVPAGHLDRASSSPLSSAAAKAGRAEQPRAPPDWIFFLDPPQAGQLAEIMEQWDMTTRKEVVQHALDIVHQTVAKHRKASA